MKLKTYFLLKVALAIFLISLFTWTLVYEELFILSMWGYLFLASALLINRLGFTAIANLFPKKYPRYENPYSVILPVKNEDPILLNKCIEMLVKQKGTKQILIGDDNSSPPLSEVIRPDLLSQIDLIINKGSGKKEMQLQLFNLAKYEIAIQMDSDILLEGEDALQKLTSYFSKENKIGIINGKIKLIANLSMTEKLQEFQYLCANEIGRSGMGRFGINPCATGELLAFRLDVFKNHLDEYANTKHIDQLMRFGEDRFMTNIFLREGYKSIVAEDVVCYTYPKKEFKTLLKQQRRWKLSGVRESVRCMRQVKNPYLKAWSLFNFTLPMVFFILFLNLLVYDLFYFNIWGIIELFSSLIVVSFFSEIPILLKNPRLFYMVVPFTFYNILFITPLWFYSVFNQQETGWGTR